MNEGRVASYSRTTQGLLRGVLLVGALGALGLLLAAWPLPVAAGLVIGVIALVSVLAQPLVGLALLIVAVPLGSPFNVQVGGFNFGPTEILFVLTVAAWLGRKVIAREVLPSPPSPLPTWERGAGERATIPPMMWPLAAYVFALALTLTVTHSLPESLKELIKWFE